jgi:hypothetical protein
MKKYDVTEQVKNQEELTDKMLDSDKPGSGVPITDDEPKGGKIDKGELREKLERGYI